MARRKKHKNAMVKDVMGIVAGSVTMGVGSQVLGGIGGTAATHGQQAIANISKFQPAIGTMTGAGHAMKALKKLKV